MGGTEGRGRREGQVGGAGDAHTMLLSHAYVRICPVYKIL